MFRRLYLRWLKWRVKKFGYLYEGKSKNNRMKSVRKRDELDPYLNPNIQNLSKEELMTYLMDRFCSREDLCESLKNYPDKVSVLDQSCECGWKVVRMYYRSSPKTWRKLAGREGWLTICPKCWHKFSFDTVKMS